MTKPIRGKVARVLNTREIAINVGVEDGVTVGMYFEVMDLQYEDIKDPDTDEVLGSIERPKVRVKVIHVQEKLSLATTYRKERVNTGGNFLSLGPFARSLMPPNWVTRYETLRKIEENRDVLDEEDSYVKIGDPVVQVIEDINTEGKVLTENTGALNPTTED